MAASLEQILAQIQRWTSPPLQELSDALLLERFVQRRDESAFAALVTRHGRMVFRTCQGVLGDVHSAEDALQATFLILARKAHTLRRPAELPGWLHGVARRVALKARKKSVVRAAEMPLPDELPDTSNDPLTRLTARELLTVLDEEVSRLPKQQRLAVISCCMEGRAKAEAARMYGWTFGSLKGHLERGRRRLQKRLARRGITLSAALALVALSPSEAVSALLVQNAVRAGLHGCIRPTASTWAHSVLRAMILPKLAGVLAVTLTVALVVTTTAALVYRRPAVEVAQDKTPAAPAAPKDAKGDKPPTRTDALGDPLPAGALARLGTVRLRHGGLIRLAAFTADGKRLLSQGSDGVRLWDAATGKQLRYFAPESGNEWGATDLAPDGKTLAAAIESSDGHIDFWDISSGRKTISFGQGYYSIVRFSPNGKLLAAFSTAKAWLAVVEIWDVANQRKLLAWKAHGGHQVLSILFSSDSRSVITSALDGKVRIWDAATGRQLRELTRLDSKPGGRVPSAYGPSEALSPDGKLLALVELNEKSKSQMGAVQWKARISLRDPASGKQRRLLTCPSQEVYPGQAPEFSALAFTAGGKKLVTGGPDNYLRVWDSATGEEMRQWPLEFGRPYALIPSRDGKTLAAVMNQGQAIQLLDMAGGKPRQSAAGHLAHVYLAALTPDGRTAITVGGDRKLLLWDVASSRIRRILKGHEDGSLSALQLAQDGKTLYTAGWDKTLRIWDLISGEERRRFPMGPEFMPAWYGALALSPGGGVLAVLSEQKKIRLLDTTTCKELHRIEGPDWCLGSAFAADGRSLVVWSGDLRVRIYDARSGKRLRDYPLPNELRIGQPIAPNGPSPTFYGAALSTDGRLLAVGNRWHSLPKAKYFLVLKDLATGRDVQRLDNLPADVNRLAFSPDGRVLAWSGTKDGSIHLLETASGGERRRLAGHAGGAILWLAFSTDGTRLISGGRDTTALIWDMRSPLSNHSASVADMETLWSDLAGADAGRAYRAIRKLAAAPAVTVPLLRKRLRPAPATKAERLSRLLSDLDNAEFTIRRNAAAELQKLGEQALPAYRMALDDKPTLEMRRRLEDLQTKAQAAWWDLSGERLRSLRAIEALEMAGTKEARELLHWLASGAEGARLTEEAKAAGIRTARMSRN